MKVFCYDLMLACLWAKKPISPGFWVHDSLLFDGVDERQVAKALQLADQKSREYGFQYICCINSDNVPYELFEPGFDFKSRVCLYLNDQEEGGLFGKRF